MIKLIYLDVLYPEYWLPVSLYSIFGTNLEESIDNDEPLNLQFNECGFQSKQFVKNSGSSFLLTILYLVAWTLLILLVSL
jgi:hypothetical protein